ncbi:MAG TPA: DMT family transporter [Candidatus Babeliales bacterium]|nr:DMT family transporter [Candidatus Babeliales bacterium]
MILIVILYMLWAASVTASKIIINYSQPFFLTGSRMFIAGSILLIYQYLSPHQEFRFKREHFGYYAQIVLLGIYITYVLRFWALHDISATKAMFLFNLSPFFSALYSYYFFKETVSKTQWAGLLIGVIGLVPVLLTSSQKELALGEFFFMSWQEMAIIASVAMHSYSWIIVRKLVIENGYSPSMINGITMFIGGALALVTSFFVEGIFPVTNFAYFFGLLAFIIIISNIICHNLYGHLLHYYSTTLIAFGGFLGPPFTAFYSWLLFQEQITWHYYLSSFIVFIGLSLFYKDELQKNNLPVA